MAEPFWTYMLRCADGKYYTGHTDDLEKRYEEHRAGEGANFTRRRLPVQMVWCQEFSTRDEAKEAERQVKKWSQAKKEALIRGDFDMISELARKRNWRKK